MTQHTGARLKCRPSTINNSTRLELEADGDTQWIANIEVSETARRLAAAYNATLGVPLDVLERLDVGRLRDDLLAAIGCLAFEIPSATWKQDVERHIRNALAALGEGD